ncbi:hypothetical protein CEXT_122971 [Caerostris extrusa]|uniref:Uncharacterized protein n=1 Tax=Caerostris extrusa TaxID=172846 RepID=A0AAV4PUZ3_CAEEX|nr:hypothetical protein CEXT_122971 [Caerostris extrusa]
MERSQSFNNEIQLQSNTTLHSTELLITPPNRRAPPLYRPSNDKTFHSKEGPPPTKPTPSRILSTSSLRVAIREDGLHRRSERDPRPQERNGRCIMHQKGFLSFILLVRRISVFSLLLKGVRVLQFTTKRNQWSIIPWKSTKLGKIPSSGILGREEAEAFVFIRIGGMVFVSSWLTDLRYSTDDEKHLV